MKSKINMILLGVLSVCVIGLLALILTYFVMAGKYKKKQALASAQTAASQTETQAQPAETSDTQVSPEPAPEEEVPSSADNSSLIYKVPGKNTTASSSAADPNAVQAAAPAVDTTTKLYLLFDETPVFVQPEGAEKPALTKTDFKAVAGQTVEPLAGMHGADPGIVPGQDLMEQALLEGVLNAGAKALIQPAVERGHRQLGQHQRQYQRRIVPKPRRVLGARTVHDAAHQHRVGHARDAQQGMEKRQDENVAPFSSRYLI